MANKQSVVEVVFDLIKPVADEMKLEIWDVKFEKIGPDWFLRIFIDKVDKNNGELDINDCENFSRKIDPIIDEADPIAQSYFLEVSSPGIERELTKNEHLKRYLNSNISVTFIRPVDGLKNVVGKLVRFEDNLITVVLEDGSELVFNKKETASIKLCFEN